MGELDVHSRTFRLASAACPYPFHFRSAADEAVELQLDAYPLGVRSDTIYPTLETALEPGDRLVFCSDGLIEAANAQEEIFGFERTAETIAQGCRQGLSAEMLIEHVIGVIKDFAGDVPQEDDMTCMVVRVE
jgi:sigma-B regulation protein RsbU (phosphoserine phosphatase)